MGIFKVRMKILVHRAALKRENLECVNTYSSYSIIMLASYKQQHLTTITV